MIQLRGYSIGEQIHEGATTLVFRATRDEDRLPVVVKVLKSELPSERQLAGFQLAFSIGERVRSPGVIEHLSLERYGQGVALITEDYGASSLDRLQLSRSSLETKLEIAVAMASALVDVHRQNVIHKDVKPQNVVFSEDTGVVKLIDFGISCQLSRENPSLAPAEKLEGTLAYISPEQTGRMNRSVDSRSDLYSLGVTLYELFSGHRPFGSEDAMELIHCHIAKQPRPLHERDGDLPRVLSEIVAKLMSKTAEDRYQGAFGVKRDLEHCLDELRTKSRIRAFPIAEHDVSDRFQLPQKLYGREGELGQLLEAFQRVSFGGRELLLVGGYSGIGKSALIREVHKPIVEHRGYFCSGKFDQFRRDIPYQALIDALRDLLQQILSEDPERLERVRADLEEALGPNGRVIADVVPELEQILGEQPEVPELGPSESHNRFNRVFNQFLQVFARADHPLTIFLDDLQWADQPSLQLMKVLISNPTCRYLLMVGAYRDNEVNETHPMTTTVHEIEEEGQAVGRMFLEPLDSETVLTYVADALHRTTEQSESLGTIVFAKTQGNPFFVGEFLSTLYQDGHIDFDGASGEWTWDMEAISDLEITDNVVDLMTAKLKGLPEDTLEALRVAACVGGRFDLRTLSLVLGRSRGATARVLSRALSDGLVLPLDESYKYMEALGEEDEARTANTGTAWYRFLHDRVHQAAYSLLEELARKELHLKIGRLLEERSTEADRDELLMSIANHFDMAKDLVDSPAERRDLAQLHLEAGRRAKDSMAFAPATHYLDSALGLLAPDAWATDYDFALAVHVDAADAMFLTERYAEMDELVDRVLAEARDLIDEIPVHNIRIQAKIFQKNPWEALDISLGVLEKLGVRLPQKPTKAHVLAAVLRTKLMIGRREPAEFAKLPPMADPRKLAAMDILRLNASSAYFVNPNLFPIIVVTMVQLSVRHGNSSFAANGYELYGMLLCGALGEFERGYEFGRLGFQVLEQYPDAGLAGKMSMIWNAFIAHWREPSMDCARALLAGWRPAVDGGDLEYGGYCVLQSFNLAFLSGMSLRSMLERYDEYAIWLRGSKQEQAVPLMDCWFQAARNLADEERVERRLSGELFDYDERLPKALEAGDLMTVAYSSMADGALAYVYRDLERARASLGRARKHVDQIFSSYMIPGLNFYESLTAMGLAARDGGRSWSRIVRRNQRQIRKWMAQREENHVHRWHLVEAERLRLLGRRDGAGENYRTGIDLARRNGYAHDEALGNELCAGFWLDAGEEDVARLYMTRARHAYRRWGAIAKVRDLEATHPELLSPEESEAVGSFITATASTSDATQETESFSLDLVSVLKASQAISGEVSLAELLRRLITIVIENAGAERGCLLLNREGDEFRIEAEGTADGSTLEVLHSRPLHATDGSSEPPLPVAIVHYVTRTRQTVVLDDATEDHRFGTDPYVRDRKPRSILCDPILNQGELTGLLYLENNLTTGAFTAERLEVLSLLSGQFASSIQRAELYDQLEEKVQERTEQLEVRNRFIRQTFGRYLSQEVVDSLFEDEEGLDLGGEKRRVTIMMTDLRGFTSMSEALPPEKVVAIINNYLSVMTEVIMRYGGTIDEFIGDAILVVFGAPLLGDDDAERAVACALEMQLAMNEVNERNRAEGLPEVEMGIGLNTGEVVVGNIGSEKRVKYGVVGSNVNLCSRIESFTVGSQILVSQNTVDDVGPALRIDGRFQVHPKGVPDPIELHEIGGIGAPHDLELPRSADDLAALTECPGIRYSTLQERRVSDDAHDGRIVGLSVREAEIEGPERPRALSNLRLRLLDQDGIELPIDLYGKVLGRDASADGRFLIRFTSVPTQARDFLDGYLESDERQRVT